MLKYFALVFAGIALMLLGIRLMDLNFYLGVVTIGVGAFMGFFFNMKFIVSMVQWTVQKGEENKRKRQLKKKHAPSSSQSQNVNSPAQTNNEPARELIAASIFYSDIGKKALTIDNKLHAETLIISVARMAGSLMFRSFGFDKSIEPGTAVLSDQANLRGPILMQVMLKTLNNLGNKIDENSMDSEYASAAFSQLTFKESHDRLASFYLAYQEKSPISLEDAATSAAIATGSLIHECSKVLSIDKGAALAVYGFVEGTKTQPFPTIK